MPASKAMKLLLCDCSWLGESLHTLFRQCCLQNYVSNKLEVCLNLTRSLWLTVALLLQYVAREIMNHSHLLHPHIVQFKEVSHWATLIHQLPPQEPSHRFQPLHFGPVNLTQLRRCF